MSMDYKAYFGRVPTFFSDASAEPARQGGPGVADVRFDP